MIGGRRVRRSEGEDGWMGWMDGVEKEGDFLFIFMLLCCYVWIDI
jgi:hypothetical protein